MHRHLTLMGCNALRSLNEKLQIVKKSGANQTYNKITKLCLQLKDITSQMNQAEIHFLLMSSASGKYNHFRLFCDSMEQDAFSPGYHK